MLMSALLVGFTAGEIPTVKVNRLLLEMKRESDGYQIYENVHTLVLALQALYGELEPFMEEHDSFENRDLVLDFYFQLRDFLTVYEDLGDDYQIYSECLQDGRFGRPTPACLTPC